MKTPLLTGFILCSLMISTSGCDLFLVRDSEEPTIGGGSGWQFPRNPNTVLINLANSVGSRSVVNYMRNFEENLPEQFNWRFDADFEARNTNPERFESWDLEKERQHVQSLFSPANLPLDSISILFYNIDKEIVIGDTADISISYNLRMGHTREIVPRRLEGKADFRMIRSLEGGWLIIIWSDFRISGEPCWSDLKAYF